MIRYWWLIWRLAATVAFLSVPLILHEYLGSSPEQRQVADDPADEIIDRLDKIEQLLLTQQELLTSHIENHHQEAVAIDNAGQTCQTRQKADQDYSLTQHNWTHIGDSILPRPHQRSLNFPFVLSAE